MKFLRYFLIELVLLLIANEAAACGPSFYVPGGYHMYRICEMQPKSVAEEYSLNVKRNCEEWQRLTSEEIPTDDIYHAVYKMTLEELEAVAADRTAVYDNRFIEWITKNDAAILDFLLLAKTNEHIRIKLNSRWYYPSMKTGAGMTIEEVAEKALAQTDERLRDRYLLQAVRALFSMSRFAECVGLWESEVCRLPEDNLMRRMILPYIAGAEYRQNRSDKALEYFARLGDVNSMLFCLGRDGEKISKVDALALVCKYAPESEFVLEVLQAYVRSLEPDGDFYSMRWGNFSWYNDRMRGDFSKLISLCLEMACDSRVTNQAMWYYTAAFMYDLDGDVATASKLLAKAEQSRSTGFIDESVKVFRIYLDAKLKPYDSVYENMLFAQLKWLDSKICNDLTDEVCDETALGYKLTTGIGYYYWNDMMRRILLAEVCPRMIKAGRTTRALQLANMADNRLLQLVDRQYGSYYAPDNTYTMLAYRYSANNFNEYDYSNHFFEMIDTLGIDAAVGYVKCVDDPKTEFDRFLNARGYTGRDYLNDILGTQYLRNMCYAKALECFGTISNAYQTHHNLYLGYDPFCAERKSIELKTDFKYDFAREMHSLEQGIEEAADPNRKGRLMVKMAIGIKNSFDFCWPLTQFYCGTTYYSQVCEKRDWTTDWLTHAARESVENLLQTAFGLFTDDEVAAEMHYALYNFRTVATKFPNTEMGELVRGQCDYLYDHDPLSRRYSNCTGYGLYF